MNYKNKVYETETEIIYEIEEIVLLKENGVYNTTYLAESIIATAYLNDNKEVLVRYLYKEKKPEIVKKVNSITVEYATNYGVKKMKYTNIDMLSINNEFSRGVRCRTELNFEYGGFE